MARTVTRADVDKILELFPMDEHGTGHIADCGFDANDERCDCYTLPERIAAILAPLIAQAEQRGREDNADHGMCYVSGSKALDARERTAGERALTEADRRISWHTTCGNCADILDRSYADYVRAEQAEAKVARVEVLADRMQQMADSAINSDNHDYLGAFAASLRAALAPETPEAGDA